MKLTLDSRVLHTFTQFTINILKESGLFSEIINEEIPENNNIFNLLKNLKHKHGSISVIKIDGKIIILDNFFNSVNSHSFIMKYKLIDEIKPDLYIIDNNRYKPLVESLPCPLKTWVIFPCDFELVNKFNWAPGNINNVFSSGRHSLRFICRRSWFDKAQTLGFNTYYKKPVSEHITNLMKSNWGVILSKFNIKNAREYEFISNKMPLALNYQPYYDAFPFNPMEHYFLMKNVDDLEKLLTIDPTPYHEKSKWLWENYYRPDKATQLLLSWLK